MKRHAAILVPLALVAGVACKKEPPPPPPPPPVTAPPTTMPAPVSVTTVTLGSAIGADKRVTAPSEAFGARDTIYAVVDTGGAGHATLRALWTFVKGDKTAKVDETTMEIDATGPAVNEFHVSKPSGWPKGNYKVEIFLNDAATPAATKTFKVS
ncbi:MAG TPA: hypothetical protein VII13_03395 [Vicinamibacteria bacterium]|jgi:hypothetical protein